MASQFSFPTTGGAGSASDIPPGTGYVVQDPPGTFGNQASIPGSDLDAGSVTNAKLQYSTVTLAQPAAGLTISSSLALGGTATFALADDLAAVEGLSTTGFVKRTGPSAWATQASISLATDVSGTLSGASITDYTIPNYKLEGGTVGRVMVDGGGGGQWLGAGTNNYLLRSNGGSSLPAWTDTLTGINISGATNSLSEIPTSALSASFLLPVAKGGTGITTPLTTGALLYASTTTSWDQLAAGTSGYVLTSNGAGSAPSYKVPITDSTGSAEMSGSSYSVTSTTFANIGLTAPLPSAGKWRVTAEVRVQLQVSVGTGNVTLRMHDGTSAITKTERISPYSSGSVIQGATVPVTTIVTVAGATNIDIQAAQGAGATYSSASVVTDGSGRSMIFWERLS